MKYILKNIADRDNVDEDVARMKALSNGGGADEGVVRMKMKAIGTKWR
jgi:hypothetical protein